MPSTSQKARYRTKKTASAARRQPRRQQEHRGAHEQGDRAVDGGGDGDGRTSCAQARRAGWRQRAGARASRRWQSVEARPMSGAELRERGKERGDDRGLAGEAGPDAEKEHVPRDAPECAPFSRGQQHCASSRQSLRSPPIVKARRADDILLASKTPPGTPFSRSLAAASIGPPVPHALASGLHRSESSAARSYAPTGGMLDRLRSAYRPLGGRSDEGGCRVPGVRPLMTGRRSARSSRHGFGAAPRASAAEAGRHAGLGAGRGRAVVHGLRGRRASSS